MSRWPFILLLCLTAGCSANLKLTPARDTIVWNRDIAPAARNWRQEAGRWFTDPVIFVSHGGYLDDKWFCFPDGRNPQLMETVANTLASVFPDRPIVLVVCNADGYRISAPSNVFYARRIVKVWPWRQNPRTNWAELTAREIEDFRNN